MSETKHLELTKVSVQAGAGELAWRIIDGRLEIRLGEFAKQAGEGWTRHDIAPGDTTWTIFADAEGEESK